MLIARKDNRYLHVSTKELDVPTTALEVTVKRLGERRYRVRGTLTSYTYVRVCEALIETEGGAAFYAADMQARRAAGLDPLAGMDCVETYPLGDDSDDSRRCGKRKPGGDEDAWPAAAIEEAPFAEGPAAA